ncbi:MAG TPA: LpxD N-terminal domain-containing protein, partial [Terriglobales bacterium]|nr:LpxD N-terminal domain-containing protein [Terriglobales bacterium]
MQRTIREIADFVGGGVNGLGAAQVTGIASISAATAEDLVFAEDEKTLELALASHAGGVLTGMFCIELTHRMPMVFSPYPRLAFARAARFICPPVKLQIGIHASAVVS